MTEDDFIGWRSNPQTKEIYQYIKEKREDLKELLAGGSIPQENREKCIGLCQAYQDVLMLDFSNFSNEEDNDTRDKPA